MRSHNLTLYYQRQIGHIVRAMPKNFKQIYQIIKLNFIKFIRRVFDLRYTLQPGLAELLIIDRNNPVFSCLPNLCSLAALYVFF